jgi:hypothetical protein
MPDSPIQFCFADTLGRTDSKCSAVQFVLINVLASSEYFTRPTLQVEQTKPELIDRHKALIYGDFPLIPVFWL